jgi:hypothetical protein
MTFMKRAKSLVKHKKNIFLIAKKSLHFCAAVLFFKHDRERKRIGKAQRSTGTSRKRSDRPYAGRSNHRSLAPHEKDPRKNQSARKIILATERKITENKNMNITKADLYEALIQARVALSKDIRETLRGRHLSYVQDLSRKSIREKIAAYRLLSNLSTINAESYSDNRSLRHVKKALAK